MLSGNMINYKPLAHNNILREKNANDSKEGHSVTLIKSSGAAA